MRPNVGSLDRILRIALGVVLIVLAATHFVGLWGWIGVLPLVTGLFSRCPAYTLFGFSTCGTGKA